VLKVDPIDYYEVTFIEDDDELQHGDGIFDRF
jgi:hypothetical protein